MLIVNNTSMSDVVIRGIDIPSNQSYTVISDQERLWFNDPTLNYNIVNGLVSVGDGVSTYIGSNAVAFVQFQSTLALDPAYAGSYILTVDITPTTLISGTSYWSMRNNTSGNRMFIKKIVVQAEFTGIALASNSKLGFSRFSGGTPSGGTALSAVPTDSLFPVSNLLDARRDNAGLTLTGVIVEPTALIPFSLLNELIVIPPFNLVVGNPEEAECVCLNPGEGIILQATNVVAAGMGFHGYVQYDERT